VDPGLQVTGAPSGGGTIRYGFDHAAIAVRDLRAAVERFSKIGFHVEAGGNHPGFGTANALIHLENGYVELLAVEDVEVARAAGIRRRELVEYLEARPGGLIGYALTCDSLERVGLRLGRVAPRLVDPPLRMSRTRPDGSTLHWRLLVPGGSTWCRPWPFLIEWEEPHAAPPASGRRRHTNGASAIDALVVGTTSLEDIESFYRENLGLPLRRLPSRGRDDPPRAAVDVGGCRIELVEVPPSSSPGPLAGCPGGEGPLELRIRVPSIEAVAGLLTATGVPTMDLGPHRLGVEPNAADGARLVLVDEAS